MKVAGPKATSHHRTLDRIENLKVTVKLYRNAPKPILIDELEVKWLELINPQDLKRESKVEESAEAVNTSKRPKKSKRRAGKTRVLFTVIDEVQAPPHQKLAHLHNSNDLERDLTPQEKDTGFLMGLYSSDGSRSAETGTPSDDAWIQRGHSSAHGEMSIMARIPPEEKKQSEIDLSKLDLANTSRPIGEKEEDYELCRISYHGNGNFSITPNFSDPDIIDPIASQLHHLKVGEILHLYSIHPTSATLSAPAERKEFQLFTEFFSRLSTHRQMAISPLDFHVPASHIRYTYLGEVVSVLDFHTDILYLSYTLHLPPGWKTDPTTNPSLLQAHSQTVHSKCLDNGRVGYFNLPLEFSLLIRAESAAMIKTPTLYLKVMSVDGHDRHSVEGYGSFVLPRMSGQICEDVRTWRPVSDRASAARTFFLGGGGELGEERYNEFEGGKKVLNRYGFQTESCGLVKVKFSTIKQVEIANSATKGMLDMEKQSQEINFALERANLRLKSLKMMDTASPTA